MSVFSALQIEKVNHYEGSRQFWVLHTALVMRLALNGHPIRVVVPKGFETDFASVPWWLQPMFTPAGPWCEAAVVHDWLYGQKACSRFLADAIFREAMFRLGIPMWRRVIAYYAVRLFGGKPWRRRSD